LYYGPELVCKLVRSWLAHLDVQTLFIELGSPWENGYIESFNAKLRDELLNRELFYSLWAAKVFVERWRSVKRHLLCLIKATSTFPHLSSN